MMVVDDSSLMVKQITAFLNSDPDIQVIAQAADGIEALEKLETAKPDVITLDVEMPRMNGLTALKHIMVKHETPTLMISAITPEGSKTAFDAFKYGAIDVIAKPSKRADASLDGQKADIITKVKRAADIRTGKSRYVRISPVEASRKPQPGKPADSATRFVGIGVGTGGYYSMLKVIPNLPREFANVLIVVILAAPKFVAPFVSYLDTHSKVSVRSPHSVTVPAKGVCYVSSGLEGALLRIDDTGLILSREERSKEPLVTGPIDRLFKSLARIAGNRAVGVVMSGAGYDGAEGIVAIRKAGGVGVVQDITNCMDPSMPLSVLEKGSVEKILPDFLMAQFLADL